MADECAYVYYAVWDVFHIEEISSEHYTVTKPSSASRRPDSCVRIRMRNTVPSCRWQQRAPCVRVTQYLPVDGGGERREHASQYLPVDGSGERRAHAHAGGVADVEGVMHEDDGEDGAEEHAERVQHALPRVAVT